MLPRLILLSAVLAFPAAAAGPAPGQVVPFLTVPGGFTVAVEGDAAVIAVVGPQGREKLRYTLPGCAFCDGADAACAREGVFAVAFAGPAEPLIGASCHGPDGSQRFVLLAPGRDKAAPVFEVRGDSFAAYAVEIDGIRVRRDRGGRAATERWQPDIPQDAGELDWVRANADAAEGRQMPEPMPVDDPDLQALAARLGGIAAAQDGDALAAMAAPDVRTSFGGGDTPDELRLLIGEPWFWDEFARLLAGGGALLTEAGGSRLAVFPTAFHTWPDDLDAFSFVYGDRAGGRLRAGPSETAPPLVETHGRILARGPAFEGDELLRQAGWSYLCLAPVGCGYARDSEVRSPIDYRAILSQPAPGAPWVLETLVAGD